MDEMESPLLYVSNPTIDVVRDAGGSAYRSVGGPGLHGSWAAARLGVREIYLVGMAGLSEADLIVGAYRSRGVEPILLDAECTATFIHTYIGGGRRTEIKCAPGSMPAARVLKLVSELRPRIIIVAPVYDEVKPSLAAELREYCELSMIDLQGFIRSRLLEEVLKLRAVFSAIHFSSDDVPEAEAETLASRLLKVSPIVYYTRASRGVDVYLQGGFVKHVSVKVIEGDPTGAGDVFTTASAIMLSRGVGPVEAAETAATLASAYVARRAQRGKYA